MRFIGDPVTAAAIPASAALRPAAIDMVTLPIALRVWSAWTIDIPPTGSTGNKLADKLIADGFRALLVRETKEQRLRWLEANVFTVQPMWGRHRPSALFYETMLDWWLQLYDDRGGH